MKWNDLKNILTVGGEVVVEVDHGTMLETQSGTIEEIDWNGDFPIVRINNLRDDATGAPINGCLNLDFFDLNEDGGLAEPIELPGVVRFLHMNGLAGNFILPKLETVVLGTNHTVPQGTLDMSTLKYQ